MVDSSAVQLIAFPPDDAAVKSLAKTVQVEGLSLITSQQTVSAQFVILLLPKDDSAYCDQIRTIVARGPPRLLVAAKQPPFRSMDVWKILEAGADDVLLCAQFQTIASDLAARIRQWITVDELLDRHGNGLNLIGSSPPWRSAMRRVVEAARFSQSPILLMGETGTGKEVAARLAVSVMDHGGSAPFATVDCGTIVPSLSGSELFGHERGAFTGATSTRDGAIAGAHGGVLFLDEIGELPLDLQAQLLRVLQDGSYKRVGGNTRHKSRFRLICATNRDLGAEVEAGRFRRDLYHRIAGTCIGLPSLQDRRDDILPLAEFFLRELLEKGVEPELDDSLRAWLLDRAYPGNTRDLRQLCVTMASRHHGSALFSVGDIDPSAQDMTILSIPGTDRFAEVASFALACGMSLREIRERIADAAIEVATERARGNLAQAAACLGVTPRALQLRRRRGE